MDPATYHGKVTYFNGIPQQHVKSAKKWMEDGLFLRSDMPAFAENPTLTGYTILKKVDPHILIPTVSTQLSYHSLAGATWK